MHVVHLACVSDTLTSVLWDLSETSWPWPGTTRDKRLEVAWGNYKKYCQDWGIVDRCERKTFSNEALRSDYATLSQKYMRAAAARYVVFWLQSMMDSILQDVTDPEEHLLPPAWN